MPDLTALFASGHAADLVLAVLAIEALILLRAGRPAIDVALLLLPGACMMLSLRAALVGASWPLIALPLAASFPVHLADMLRRGKGR
ncbi:hypothetical protein [Novosphingobium sp.]|uniref:hypothetical protein n=1 Tax=Novosphingobium sp. TaxID=1874826 RepID=UPI001DA39905|nr:hypothetical protein [Novosphingobium sp.]MBX9665098.1 hypothetical protein [Novosphingobium sp.]